LFRWYCRAITQEDAENILTKSVNPSGSFLVRDSETTLGDYILSVKDKNKVIHYPIRSLDVGGYFITLRLTFKTVPDLISHYNQKADGLCTPLQYPCVMSQSQTDPWEISLVSIRATKVIEIHHYCEIFEGVWNNKTQIAIHTPKEDFMSAAEFLEVVEVMKQLKHPNIIKLYGVCTQEKPMCMITEFMNVGNLQAYLKSKANCLKESQLIDMGAQVAAGMAYLESKSCVHRNLRAKNILLQLREGFIERIVCKVANFSFARIISDNNCVKTAAQEKFPVKWTAPETIKSGCFTIKSDVWSFGIVLHEIFTFGAIPYPGILISDVLSKLESDYRMPCPPNCPKKLYIIMEECWRKDADTRPTFETLQWKLEDYYYSDYVDN